MGIQTKEPLIMGVVNVTPDSFSDGGRWMSPDEALKHGCRLVEEGADLLDIGGESTRPGAMPISIQEELDRVIPVIERIKKTVPVKISIDTNKSSVAKEAIKAGATVINDVTAGQDPGMSALVKEYGVHIILMHMRGSPATMQVVPMYPHGVVHEVKEYLSSRVSAFLQHGISKEQIWIDPGIGFGKTGSHNIELLRSLENFLSLGVDLVVGTSRKSFLAYVLDDPQLEFELREPGTVATNLWAYTKGARVFRVHNVGNLKKALVTWRRVENGC